MAIEIVYGEDPTWALTISRPFLSERPVLHNLILTLLHERISRPRPGRYWVATDGGDVVGVVLQSPLSFAANITPMESEVIAEMTQEISHAQIELPGVSGEAATAAAFAGFWTERRKSAAVPYQGQRIYEAVDIREPSAIGGSLRQAERRDRNLLVEWVREFQTEIGEEGGDPASVVDVRLPTGRFWLWEQDGEPVSLAAISEPMAGVARVQIAYTPRERRNLGYGGACVSAVTRHILAGGCRCMLYTDLANPASNAVFRRIGYRAVAEGLRYRFM